MDVGAGAGMPVVFLLSWGGTNRRPCCLDALLQGLNERCARELAVIGEQYPFEPLQFLPKTLRLEFAEGIAMLQEAGHEVRGGAAAAAVAPMRGGLAGPGYVPPPCGCSCRTCCCCSPCSAPNAPLPPLPAPQVDPFGDLNTALERALGALVKERYGTEFYMLHRYPSAIRPFYTMPCKDDPRYSCSFDIFIRGEEIISGAQVGGVWVGVGRGGTGRGGTGRGGVGGEQRVSTSGALATAPPLDPPP